MYPQSTCSYAHIRPPDPSLTSHQSSSDLPLLVNLRNIANRLLKDLAPGSSQPFRIGFITPPFKDTKIPVTDHLHAHAYVEPADQLGWWRGVAFSSIAWYAIDDLIAEIR